MIEMVFEGRKKDLGGGLEVGRILPFAQKRMVGPFIFLDHMGPADFLPGQGVNVRPHPHIGLSTCTYLFQGEIRHQDSLGYDLSIRPGEVNWMTAGRGIVHSERTDPELKATGARMHGMQAWIALPNELEETDPGFWHHEGDEDLPSFQSGGLWARMVAGSAFGASAKVKTSSPMFYVHWELQPGTKTAPPDEHSERALYVAQGVVEIAGREFREGQMIVFEPGGRPTITALTQCTLMCLGGEPVGERIIWWNLVASSQDKIDRAKADWAAWKDSPRFSLPPNDNEEYIPLPAEERPPERMS